MKLVHISDPCPRKVSQMTPAEGGHFCGSCSKVVVDFTGKTDEEILSILANRHGQRTCGIFEPSKASRGPKRTFELARFAAAVFLVFGALLFSGCKDEPERVMGDVCIDDSASMANRMMQFSADSTHLADSIYHVDSAMKASHSGGGSAR